MNSNFSSNPYPARRRVYTRTQQTPFKLANRQYQLTNNIYSKQYTTQSKNSNGLSTENKSNSQKKIRSVSSKSLFNQAKGRTNSDVWLKTTNLTKFTPMPKQQIQKNHDHESVQKKLKQVLNQKLNKRILKIQQQKNSTEGVRKALDDTLKKWGSKPSQQINMNIKLRKQNLQQSHDPQKFKNLITQSDTMKIQKSRVPTKQQSKYYLQSLINNQKSEVSRKSIGVEVNLSRQQRARKQQQMRYSKIGDKKQHINENKRYDDYQMQKQYTDNMTKVPNIPINAMLKSKNEQDRIKQQLITKNKLNSQVPIPKTKAEQQYKYKKQQISKVQLYQPAQQLKLMKQKQAINTRKQEPQLSTNKQLQNTKYDDKNNKIVQQVKKVPVAKLQQGKKPQLQPQKSSKVDFNDKQQFDFQELENITLSPQSKYTQPKKQQPAPPINNTKKQPKKQNKVKSTKQQKVLPPKQQKQQSKQQEKQKQQQKLKKQGVDQKKKQQQRKAKQLKQAKQIEQKRTKMINKIQNQLNQANRIINMMTPVGQVAPYCSQAMKKSKLNWFTPAILLYKECYQKFVQYEDVYGKAAQLKILPSQEKDKYIQDNATILKNLQKIIGMAKKKGKLSQQHQKLAISTQPVHLATIIQKQVLAFGKQLSQSQQQQNYDILRCYLRMINSIKILAVLKGFNTQIIQDIDAIDDDDLPIAIKKNYQAIQLKKIKL